MPRRCINAVALRHVVRLLHKTLFAPYLIAGRGCRYFRASRFDEVVREGPQVRAVEGIDALISHFLLPVASHHNARIF
jgi:hypothetical protein